MLFEQKLDYLLEQCLLWLLCKYSEAEKYLAATDFQTCSTYKVDSSVISIIWHLYYVRQNVKRKCQKWRMIFK